MKMLFISQWDMNPKGRFNGSAKKTKEQIETFCDLGINTTLYNEIDVIKESKISKIITRLPYTYAFNKLKYSDEIDGYDAYYIRFFGSDYYLYKFIKKIKKRNPNSKILLEFPDIDYMAHFEKKIKNIPYFLKNIFFLKKTKKFVNRSITMQQNNMYLGMKNISILNGIIVNKVKIINNYSILKKKEINLGIVASFQPVHGIDLLIQNLGEYYKDPINEKKIFVHVVGDGILKDEYEKLVKKYNLEKYVFFYGFKFDEELEKIYQKFDIGVCELAPFRREYKVSSSLKSREYLAKGLPIISAVKIDALNENNWFYKLIDTSTYKIDINEIIDFYESIYLKNEDINSIRLKIREFSKNNLDMKITLQPIAKYLLKGE